MELNEDEVFNRNYSIDINKSFNFGYEIFQKNMGGFVGFFVLQLIIDWAINRAFGYSYAELYQNFGNFSGSSAVGSIISFVVGALLSPGTFYVAHKIRSREETSFGDFFYAFSNEPGQFILLRLVAIISILIGLAFFVLPGIYLLVAFAFSACIQVTYKGNFWRNMQLSLKVINQVWGQMFLLLLCILGINLLGLIACGIGLLFTVPLSMCIVYAAFHDVFKPSSNTMDNKISGFGQDQRDINTERDENNYLK